MLKRLYAHNYRCFENFEINFDELTLLLGPNGGGKSSLFDLLFNIRMLVIDKAKVEALFPPDDCTAWLTSPQQSFELDVEGMGGRFSYRLAILHNIELGKQRIEQESLTFDGNPLFEFKHGEVRLYNDEHRPGPEYSFDWSVSALATIVERKDKKKLTWFEKWLEMLFIISLQPQVMTSISTVESSWLNRNGSNFADWYRYISQENQDKIVTLTDKLRNCLPGFYAFKLEQAGKHRILKVGFGRGEGKEPIIYFDFEKISDGQRVVLILYSLLMTLQEMGHVLFLDEPDNYVALGEIQPWLMELQDACGEGLVQAVIISHHPELIDYFGTDHGLWLDRDPLGPTRVKRLTIDSAQALKLSEQVTRGWVE